MAKRISKKSEPEETVADSSTPLVITYACWDCRTYYEVEEGMLVLCPKCGSQKAREV